MTPSKPIHAVIVEDEPLGRAVIRELLRQDADVTVVAECANGHEAIAAIREKRPELIFLDVRMPEIDGFEVLCAVGADRLPAVVFVTAYDEYAVRAFEVNAVDYLLKPFDRERFQQAVERAKVQVRRDHGYLQRFVIRSAGRIIFVKVDDLDWIEAEGNYVRLHAGKDSYLLRSTIGNVEKTLDPSRFARIHRSQIVNLDRIVELRPWWHGEYRVLLRDGTQLTLTRGYRPTLNFP